MSARYDEADGSAIVARLFGPGLVPVRTSDCCGDRALLDLRATRRRVTDLQAGAHQAGGDTGYVVAAVTRPSTGTDADEM